MKVKFKEWDCNMEKRTYYNGRLALQLTDTEDGSPIATATVNIPEIDLNEGEVLIKDYSENEGMFATLEAAGIVKATRQVVASGHVTIPICRYTGDSFFYKSRN